MFWYGTDASALPVFDGPDGVGKAAFDGSDGVGWPIPMSNNGICSTLGIYIHIMWTQHYNFFSNIL